MKAIVAWFGESTRLRQEQLNVVRFEGNDLLGAQQLDSTGMRGSAMLNVGIRSRPLGIQTVT